MKNGLANGEAVPEGVPLELRVGHLLRISGYLDIAILSMWARLRDLVGEAQEYHAVDDFPAAMARMRVADDLVALHLIRLAGE